MPGEDVEELQGGGALALILAADIESGASLSLAQAVLEAGTRRAAQHPEVTPRDEGEGSRDAVGRFVASYNTQWRESHAPGERDARWATDGSKRDMRNLGALPVLAHKPETLSHKLLAMGACALLTERRGFDGLDGPAGAWLAALGGHAYMPATLDKTLSQLGLLGVDDAIWDAHAGTWAKQSGRCTARGACSSPCSRGR